MRISDWSSDVCSSDLPPGRPSRRLLGERIPAVAVLDLQHPQLGVDAAPALDIGVGVGLRHRLLAGGRPPPGPLALVLAGRDRQSVVEGKSVSVRVDHGGPRLIKNKIRKTMTS